jgi:hypothetical protein
VWQCSQRELSDMGRVRSWASNTDADSNLRRPTMKTFILTAMLALTAVSGTVVISQPAAANGGGHWGR